MTAHGFPTWGGSAGSYRGSGQETRGRGNGSVPRPHGSNRGSGYFHSNTSYHSVYREREGFGHRGGYQGTRPDRGHLPNRSGSSYGFGGLDGPSDLPDSARQGPILFSPSEGLRQPSVEVTRYEDAWISELPDLSSLNMSDGPSMPRRPGYGTAGREIILRTNHFEITPKYNLQLHRYSIDVIPEAFPIRMRKRAFELFIARAPFLDSIRPAVATDNASTMITAKKLDLGSTDRTVFSVPYFESDERDLSGRDITFMFKVAYDCSLSIQPLIQSLRPGNSVNNLQDRDKIIQALNIVICRNAITSPAMTIVAQNKAFPWDETLGDLGGGLVAVAGYYTSVKTATARLILNINSVTSAFYRPGALLSLMSEFKKDHNLPGWEGALSMFMEKLRIKVTHLKTSDGANITKTIHNLARKPHIGASSREVLLHWEGKGQEVTVEEYFKQAHNIILQHPTEPVINVGKMDHPVWMPPEFCQVMPGQLANVTLSPAQTQKMIRVACRKPADNARRITTQGLEALTLDPTVADGPILFGLKVTPAMLTVKGRVLPSPNILYSLGKSILSPPASWNMINMKFTHAGSVPDWSYFRIREGQSNLSDDQLPRIIEEFRQMLVRCGMRLPNQTRPKGFPTLVLDPKQPGNDMLNIDEWLGKIHKDTSVRMLLIFLPSEDQRRYASIKYMADVKYGITTVCCQASKLQQERGRKGYFANVALKWNLKCGGVNHQISKQDMGILATTDTMVVGIDVTHPSPKSQKGAPSIAAVVASIDNKFGQYPATVRAQTSRREMVDHLEEMMCSRLKLWQVRNQRLPQNILVYRDGVSEGQYQIVLREEAPAIDSAISSLYPPNGPKPQVSILIVGKRHHSRFYPTTMQDADPRTGNPKNGTIVDRGITSEKYWDFYFQAHAALQGTARSAHYVVVKDDIGGWGTDALPALTHSLCYLYGRATKAVSVCTPAYYADVACERARHYLYNTFNRDECSTNIGSTFDWATARWLRDVHPDLKDSMFYI